VRLQDSKAFERGLHGGLDVFFAGLLMNSDDLRRLRGIQRLDLVGGLDALAADDEVILAAELAADFRWRRASCGHCLRGENQRRAR
jgi:hypothetical protein